MIFYDLHCDTPSLLPDGRLLFRNDGMLSIQKMQQGNVSCQLFALFIDLDEHSSPQAGFEHLQRMYDVFARQLAANRRTIGLARSGAELAALRRQGRIAALLTVEEGGVLDGKLERLETLYQMGVRLITLTWNHENCLGFPNAWDRQEMQRGLKPLGCEAVEEMQRRGMVVDVSHLSDGGFWDVARLSKKPFVASHSNARCLCDHPRNLTDDMLRALAKAGGVAGLNFYHRFLGADETGSLEQMVAHARHICNVAGVETLALGSDFDGFSGPCQLEHCGQLPLLAHALGKGGFSAEAVDKITWKNAHRVLTDTL